MKRLLVAMLLVVIPGVAFALHPKPQTQRARIGVLRGSDPVQTEIANALRRELRARGFDAFDAVRTYDEAVRDGAAVADYYVEISAGEASNQEYGGVEVGTRHAGVALGVLVSRVAAELRIYDGETMELVRSKQLAQRDTSIVPAAISIGGGSFFAWFVTPHLERVHARRVMRDTGRDAAAVVRDIVRDEHRDGR
ncbi:MAG: hypothetical protein M3Q69_04040 [Acidobacteriota bacterium]|nr:hypothetical protein [Acidobacteriota bacterium]